MMILDTIEKYCMIKKGDKVLVALSGGSDSVFLTHILNQYQNRLGITLLSCHVNHKLRGEDSEKDMEFCKDFCKKLHIPLFILEKDCNEFAKKHVLSLEEAGRKIRYDFFNEIKARESCNKIATAHHLNDQSETVLLRILQGCGTEGLSGILPVRGDGVIRPLIETPKQKILDFLHKENIPYCKDFTNSDTDFLRNDIRINILPKLQEINPSIHEALFRLSLNAHHDSLFIKNHIKSLNIVTQKSGVFIMPLEEIKKLDFSVFYHIIKDTAENFCKNIRLFQKHIFLLKKLCSEAKTGKGIDLSKKVRAEIEYENLILFEKKKPVCYSYALKIGETVFVKEAGLYFELIKPNLFDYNKDFSGIYIRSRKNGDKIHLADGKTKKIKDIFIDEKVPRRLRDIFPVIEQNKEVIFVYPNKKGINYKEVKITKEGEKSNEAGY